MTTRLNIVSEVALEQGQPRPIHMFRPGTFTDMNGRETAFTAADVATIAARFSKRRKLPITERHDFGQAIGRLQDVWSDGDGNLFGLPKWNAKGKTLLEDEIYDGFSCELDKDDGGWTLIGGSLTNYPAVGGLEPVTLSAPPMQPVALSNPLDGPQALIDAQPHSTPLADVLQAKAQVMAILGSASTAPAPAHEDTASTQGALPMSEPIAELVTPTPPVIADPSVQAQVNAFLSQHAAQLEAQKRQLEAQIRADFERQAFEIEQRNAIHAFARRMTMTTTDHPYALPCTPEELAQMLLEIPASARGKVTALFTRITTAGLVSFDEIGSAGEGTENSDRWSALVAAKVAAGLSRVQAIQATAREFPDLYAAQNTRGGR